MCIEGPELEVVKSLLTRQSVVPLRVVRVVRAQPGQGREQVRAWLGGPLPRHWNCSHGASLLHGSWLHVFVFPNPLVCQVKVTQRFRAADPDVFLQQEAWGCFL